ncbi:hypothetical protein VU04_02695 [Desulfobulbus sp. TB]|nr:hypothetical protein [Desulfobulbus sp. TB]
MNNPAVKKAYLGA